MALFVALTVYEGENAGASKSLAVPTSGAGGITFKTYSGTIAGVACLSQIIVPASGLNQKASIYYSASTVAALVALMV